MSQLILTPPESPLSPRRGRPRGAKNRRSLDLARYIEAQFGGMTPGQQAAQLALVTPKELRQAKAKAAALGMIGFETLSPMMLAMAVKAKELDREIGCETKEAWLLIMKEREGLLPYVHQRQPQKAEDKAGAQPIGFMIPDGSAPPGGAQPALDLDDDGGDAGIDFIGKSGDAPA